MQHEAIKAAHFSFHKNQICREESCGLIQKITQIERVIISYKMIKSASLEAEILYLKKFTLLVELKVFSSCFAHLFNS